MDRAQEPRVLAEKNGEAQGNPEYGGENGEVPRTPSMAEEWSRHKDPQYWRQNGESLKDPVYGGRMERPKDPGVVWRKN
ncbi:unnamed protein product [Staurois parvus]|uniref:Uncharacterized protein n=1 Tax=Staurois parvus TaxID=386267 RepID=A0ABN9APR7_9NEOB|nr:unnamed protein product [Staurois parvus]